MMTGTDPAPLSRANAPYYAWGDGCDGWHLVQTDALSVIEERMPPGAAEARHRHARSRQFFRVTEGELTIEVDGTVHVLSSGESLEVAPGQAHEVQNASAAPVRFLVVSQPPSHGDREPAPREDARPKGEEHAGALTVSTDPALLDVPLLHRWLAEASYWARGIPEAVVRRAVDGSLCFGAYEGGRQVGVARVVTDRATFAWLCDVFVDEAARGQGVSKTLVDAVVAHPDLRGVRRMMLATSDAHGLYARYGFEPVTDLYMERLLTDPYGVASHEAQRAPADDTAGASRASQCG